MKSWIAGCVLAGISFAAFADMDASTRAAEAALERDRAQAMARDKAAEEASQRQHREMEAGTKASMAQDYRRRLGNEANGKSDDEVIRLYREKELAAGRTP